jgi:drug/metabolite transporter (DMT)-like permease
MNIPRTPAAGLGLAGAAAAVSGVAVFVNATAVKAFGNATAYTTMKNLVAAVVLGAALVIASRRRSPAGWTAPQGAWQWLGLALVGVMGGAVAFVLFFEGLSRATATDAAFLQKTLVVWVALGALALGRERLRPVHVVAIAVLVVGQALLGVKVSSIRPGSAELLIMGATVLWAVEALIAKQLLATLSPLTVGVARMGIGSAALVGWLVVTGRVGELVPKDVAAGTWVVVTGLLLAVYVSCWLGALARVGVIDVTAILVAAVLLTATLDAVFNGKAVVPQAAGLSLIVAGVLLVVLDRAWVLERSGVTGAPARVAASLKRVPRR